MNTQKSTFGYDVSRLARRKAELGLTDKALGKRTGLHPSTINNVLTGRTCKAPTIKRIAEELGMQFSEIVVAAEARP